MSACFMVMAIGPIAGYGCGRTLKLFPVASPTLLNMRPLRSVRDLRNHVSCMVMTAVNGTPGLPPPTAMDMPRGATAFHERCAPFDGSGGSQPGRCARRYDHRQQPHCQGRTDRALRPHRARQQRLLCRLPQRGAQRADRQGFHRLAVCLAGNRYDRRTANLGAHGSSARAQRQGQRAGTHARQGQLQARLLSTTRPRRPDRPRSAGAKIDIR